MQYADSTCILFVCPPPVQLVDPASGASAPFDVLLTTYSMFERDSNDARIDRAFIMR